MSLEYTEIPVVDWTLAQRDKPLFLTELRNAMINVGFLYLSNHPIPMDLVDKVIDLTPKFFELPQEVKNSIDMSKSPHFHGYLRVGGEANDGHPDTREQFNFGGDRTCRYEEGEPEYLKLHGSALWPEDAVIPGFRHTMLDYYQRLEDMSWEFTAYVSEALGLQPHELWSLFDPDRSKLQPRCKALRYPACPPGSSGSGLGITPHCDTGVLSYLLQASDQHVLQVQNHSGNWVSVPPSKGTFVINLGRALEKATRGVLPATMHQVISPPVGARYSIAFFSSLAMHIRIAEVKFDFPQEVWDMKKARDKRTGKDSEKEFEFTPKDYELAAELELDKKIKFHPLATMRYYPNLFDKYFPNGLPRLFTCPLIYCTY
ncbi:Clavaminate synthase-like protein [Mycena sanguinolenta]|uniref:Clavaminate synthase-like protein n=1 Tax=Mycena sanguinolenta TaxID=230812 RepID=A0A8H6XB04_9AGAR|nr:Clavaminate synthase-like protein [Mycena sanguinolenta]